MNKLKTLMLGTALIAITVNAQEIGKPAPDFKYNILNGGSFTLSEQVGKVVAIFSFGYNCGFCVTSGPYVQAGLVEHYADNNEIIIIGLDMWDGAAASVTTFKNNTGLSIPLLLIASSFGSSYNTSHDRLFVIDKQGILAYRSTAAAGDDVDNAVTAIDAALGAPVGINSLEPGEFDFTIYPNPAQNLVNLSFTLAQAGEVSAKIVSIDGRTILESGIESFTQGPNQISFEVSNLNGGIYFSVLEYNGIQTVQKLLIN